MADYKIPFIISVIFLFFAIVYIIYLTADNPTDEQVKETVIELLDDLIYEAEEDFESRFKYYEFAYSAISEDIDSFYVFMDESNMFCSSEFIDFYNRNVSSHYVKTEKVLNTLCSIKNKQSQDYRLLSKLMEYRFIQEAIDSRYDSFFWLEGMGVNICNNKDTIQLGEKFSTEIFNFGHVLNEETQPIVVLDGDTLNADHSYCIFVEKPQKRGLVTHKGYMTCFHPGAGIIKLSFDFEYYVK